MIDVAKTSISSPELTNAIREKVGKLKGVESLTFGSGGVGGYALSANDPGQDGADGVVIIEEYF